MAAEDNESVQTFPPAAFDIPPKQHIEEAVVLALNVQDGQQSLGQSVKDPYTRAVRYLEKHHIVEIFQVSTSNHSNSTSTVLVQPGGIYVSDI